MISLIDLANAVLGKTRDGKLTWSEFSASSYISSLGEESIIIDRQGSAMHIMRFVNSEGKELEKLVPEYIGSEENDVLKEIYELARRQALRVDQKLLSIKRTLDNL